MRYGIPEEVVSNGGPEFDNQMTSELAYKYGFKWNSSSPEMPNANEMAESTVKQIKYIIRYTIKIHTNVPSAEILWKTIEKCIAYNEEIPIPM